MEDRLAILELEGLDAHSFDDRDGATWSSLARSTLRAHRRSGSWVSKTSNSVRSGSAPAWRHSDRVTTTFLSESRTLLGYAPGSGLDEVGTRRM